MHFIHQAHTIGISTNSPQQPRENPSVSKAKEAIARAMQSHPEETNEIINGFIRKLNSLGVEKPVIRSRIEACKIDLTS